jgi:methyl-accepting chemotaxis protein
MIGRLIERLFVSVRADMSDLSRDLSQGMAQTRTATNSMAMSWDQVSAKVDELTRSLNQHKITQGRYTSEMNRLSSAMRGVAGGYREAQREVWKYASAAQAAQRATALTRSILDLFEHLHARPVKLGCR